MAPDLRTSPDFWLPERLAKLGTFIELERNTYAEFQTLVNEWLAHIRDPVMRPGGVPGIDPNGVHSGDLVWRNGITTFTQDAIVPILARAYADNFEGDFPFTHRPFVAAHLETVENRLVHIPDEVFNDMRKLLQEGVNRGASIPEIAAEINQTLLTSNSDSWRNRATVVARTETIGAYNAGTSDAFDAVAEVLDVPMEKVWLATDDDRTRHTHREADGQRVPLDSTFTVGGAALDFPGDPTGPPQEVIQCRCTMLLVEPGEALDMSDRQLLASAGSAFVEPTTLGHALQASGLPGEWAVIDGWDHSLCVLEFCRAPLHPGPCKGWKHTLKQIAPGVYDALERVRIAKLEEKRKAKIAALKAAGKPIPKALLKPITSTDPKPPPATPGTVGVPPMVGTEAPLSPATEAKLTAVSAKVKHEFDPETVKAKKAAKAKAHKLAQAEAMSKILAEEKAAKEAKAKQAAEAKANADVEAAKAKADAEAAAPPLADSDTPSAGFIPTDQQAAAIEAAQGNLDTENTIDAYTDLDFDDFEELPPHVKAKILANIAMLAHSDALTPLEQGKLKGKYHDFTGKLPAKPADKPAAATIAEKVVAPDPPAQPDAALAKAEQIVGEAGHVPDEVHILSYDYLSVADFKKLPPHAQAKILADLQDMAGSVNNEGWVKSDAKALFAAYAGQKMPGGAPPGAASAPNADADQPNITAVPDAPATTAPTPAAAKAAKIAKAPGATPWKDRLAAYTALTQQDISSMAPEDVENIQADLAKLHTWYTKKNLKVGAKAVQDLGDSIAAKVKAKDGANSANTPPADAPPAVKPEAKPKPKPPGKLTSTGKVLGTHGATVHTDEEGQQWLVKKQPKFLNEADVATANLAAAVGLPTAEIHQANVNGTPSSVQKMMKAKAAFDGSKKIKPAELSDEQVLQLQKSQVVDWLTSNHDAHGGQFLEDEDGNLVPIDKTQSFKHFGEDALDPNYHPNAAYGEVEPVYNQMWKAYANGADINMANPSEGELAEFIAQVQGLDDDEFKAMFKAYADAAAAEGKLALGSDNPNDPEAFLNALVERKNNLAASFAKLHADAEAKRQAKLATAKSQPPPIGAEVAPSVAEVLDKPAPPEPVYNSWQQNVIDGMDAGDASVAVAAPLIKSEYDGLPAATKAKLVKALAENDVPVAHTLYETYTGVPHPKAGHAVSADPAPTPEPDTPSLPTGPPKNTFQEWQDAKQVVKGKTYKGKNKAVADKIKSGTAGERLAAYQGNIPDKATFQKMPPELRTAIVADLDNMALSSGDFFTPEQKSKAAQLREAFTGKPAGSEWTAPTSGQPKKFTSQAAEKAHNVALNPGLHTTQERLDTYKKLSAVGFKSLPPETQQAIVADLAGIDSSLDVEVKESTQAASLHLKLTGKPVGDDFEPLTPDAKPKSKKKFVSSEAEAAYNEAKEGKPLGYYSSEDEFHAKYSIYSALSQEDFESLPSTVQKQIIKDVGALSLSKSPYSYSEAEALKTKLGAGGWNWKPKTAAMKKAAELQGKSAAELAKIAADYKESAAGKSWEAKTKDALPDHAALESLPLSLMNGTVQNAPTTNGVTGSEMSSAIGAYKGSSYTSINSVLRKLKGEPLEPGTTVTDRVNAIDAAMSLSRTPAATVTWRGVRGRAIFGSHYDGDLTGVEFTEHGYGSTSASRGTSAGFAGGGSEALMMRVLIPPGTGAIKVSGKEYESELLLERGLRWRVVADRGIGSDGRRRIDVEIIND